MEWGTASYDGMDYNGSRVLILLVALLNFFHLLAGSFLTRMREFSIRRVAGASGDSLFVQLFTQSAMFGFAGRPVDRCLH